MSVPQGSTRKSPPAKKFHLAPRYRVLIAKSGLDGHDRGAKVVARALRDDGFEVIYTGIRSTPEEIACTAVDEDVAAIGLSSLSGAHLEQFPAVLEALRKHGVGTVPVLGGGVIPEEDHPFLQAAGIKEIFTPGATLARILASFRENCRAYREPGRACRQNGRVNRAPGRACRARPGKRDA